MTPRLQAPPRQDLMPFADAPTGYMWPRGAAEPAPIPAPPSLAARLRVAEVTSCPCGATPECPRLARPCRTAPHRLVHLDPALSQAGEPATGAFLVSSPNLFLWKQRMQLANQNPRDWGSHEPGEPPGDHPTLLVSSTGRPLMPPRRARPGRGLSRGASVWAAAGTRPKLTFSGWAHPAERSTCTPWLLFRPQDLREKAGSGRLPETGREPAARNAGSVHPSAVLAGPADGP